MQHRQNQNYLTYSLKKKSSEMPAQLNFDCLIADYPTVILAVIILVSVVYQGG